MNVLIVEDETAASENLKQILAEADPSINIAGITESVSQTTKWLQSHAAPDLIMMDIHLSDGSAFNVFQSVTVETPIVFTTAYDEYALEAFKVNSIDYILKPVSVEAIKQALQKFARLTHSDAQQYVAQQSLLAPTGKYIQKILVPIKDKLIPIQLDDVSFIYTTGNNTSVYLKNGVVYPYSRTLESMMKVLNPAMFFRANKQYVIAKSSVQDITVWFDSRLFLTLDVEEVPERIYVSKNRASDFKKWMVS